MRSRKSVHEICSVDFTYNQFIKPICKALSQKGYKVYSSYNRNNAEEISTEDNNCSEYIRIESYRSISPVKLIKSLYQSAKR